MRFFNRFLINLLVILFLQDAMGFTINNTLGVTATVGGDGGNGGAISGRGGRATMGSSTPIMKFPNYYPLNFSPSRTSATFTATITPNVAYDIKISQGQGVGATENQRYLTQLGGTQQLKYNLFQDSGYQHPYGSIGQVLRRIGTGLPETITIYGEIPSNQMVEAGIYLDRVIIFITF